MTNSKIDSRSIVTPYEFGVAEHLIGRKLARPSFRLNALLIDLVIIALLSTLSASILALVILLVSLRAIWRWRHQQDRRKATYFLVFVSFVCCVTLLVQGVVRTTNVATSKFTASTNDSVEINLGDEQANEVTHNWLLKVDDVSPTFTSNLADLRDAAGNPLCTDKAGCEDAFFYKLLQLTKSRGYDQQEAEEIVEAAVEFINTQHRPKEPLSEPDIPSLLYGGFDDTEGADSSVSKPLASITQWFMGLMEDLGLSFGWAAVYFSVLTAWSNGQTIGKKLFRIQVIKIDGNYLDLWDSFGRYGGYGAGLATGLLGFVQIYWDPNRQAIQDKISETLVTVK
ncbi:MAG: RDD family protein [Pseudomonadota bacterium]